MHREDSTFAISTATPDQQPHPGRVAVVAIGRNEGQRLERCLASLPIDCTCVYVDSASTDGSVELARQRGAEIVELDMSVPFSAARARNAGFDHLRKSEQPFDYVQFVDGDCELASDWLHTGAASLDANPTVAVVFGRRRERFPERSVFNWMCDREWDGSPGEVRECGGDALIRVNAFEAVRGYDDSIIAGEEPELCLRLRRASWRVWRLGSEMTLHDAAILRFGQWWRRTVRSGYGYAQCAYLHHSKEGRLYVRETIRAFIWGFFIPIVCLAATFSFPNFGWIIFGVYPAQLARLIGRGEGTFRERTVIAIFQIASRFAEVAGQIKFLRHRLLGLRGHIIEYK
uniref:Glycosyl transferase, family 2 n=1 Tax=Rhodopseudomonas palustris (strain BisA53) TaxID=316055 RepID=Q07SM9_RHOP5